MSLFTKLANAIFSPVDGYGNNRSVENVDVQRWGTEVERSIEGAAAGRVDAATWSNLNSIAGERVGQPATVYGPDAGTHTDPVTGLTVPNEGFYAWSASPAGWRRVGNLPDDGIIRAENSGSGTPNAARATTIQRYSTDPYAALISVNFVAPNTGAMTLSINGEPPRPVVTNTGEPLAAGYVQAGMAVLVQIDEGGNYRLFSYGDADSVLSAAEAAQAASEDAADRAESAAAGVEYPVSYAPQSLTEMQQAQARQNIGAANPDIMTLQEFI